MPPASRVLVTLGSGLLVGWLTALGQGWLDAPFSALVNSASAWLVLPWVLGTLAGSRREAAVIGLVACLLQVAGYYATDALRGLPPGGSGILLFWSACALVGGPLFAAAGHHWRTGPPATRGLGGAVLPAAFLAEGLWVYGNLAYWSTMALWLAIGAALAITLTRRTADLRFLALTLPAGIAGEILVTTLLSQPLS